jgi:hypothetical protein
MPKLGFFAYELAQKLPGDWSAESADPLHHRDYWDTFNRRQRIWTPSEAHPMVNNYAREDAMLHAEGAWSGLQLYLVAHRSSRVLVCPLIPADVPEDLADRIPAPPSIATSADPARAAWRITERLLPHYLTAVSAARRAVEATTRRAFPAPAPAQTQRARLR